MTNQVTIEIQTAPGVWTDITSDVYLRDPLTITRGKSDEQSQASPQRMSFTIEDRDGKYSPRNPLSPLYGKVGRNTPVRCKIDDGSFTRFYGDIPGIAPRWDEAHSDRYIQVEAYGILRRLGQGEPPVSNGLRDWAVAQPTLAAYFPLSGGEGTTYSQNLAPGGPGSFGGRNDPVFTYGVDMGAAWLGTGMELNSTETTSWMQGSQYVSVGSNSALDFVFRSDAFGVLDVQLWPTWDNYFNLRLNTSADAGTAQVSYYDDLNGTITEPVTAAIPALQDTRLHTCRFQLATVAGVIQYSVYIDGVLITSGDNGLTQTLAGTPLFRFFYDRFTNQTVMNMAHLAVWTDNTLANIPTALDYTDAAFAYAGETAIDRITRICTDAGITLLTVGTAADSMPMGPQFTETRLEQIRDVEATDMGILFESQNAPALTYISRTALYNQASQFTLQYNNGQVVAPLEPTDDDQVTRNDVTATRREGSSVRYTVDTGPMSTQDPPTGVGRYATEVTVNVESENLLDAVAGWVLNIGTLDQARWPSVTVNLNSPNISALSELSIKDADIGDRFVITGMQKAFVYDDVSLIIVGYTETITPFIHTITFNCMPAEPYEVFVVDNTNSRISAGDTSLVNASMTTTVTSMSVLSADAKTLWTTAGGDMPISLMVNGEEMTATAISGTTPGSAQTDTVARGVNGVVKTHSTGEVVRLKREAVIAL